MGCAEVARNPSAGNGPIPSFRVLLSFAYKRGLVAAPWSQASRGSDRVSQAVETLPVLPCTPASRYVGIRTSLRIKGGNAKPSVLQAPGAVRQRGNVNRDVTNVIRLHASCLSSSLKFFARRCRDNINREMRTFIYLLVRDIEGMSTAER